MTISSLCFISPGAYAYFNPQANVTAGGAERQLYLLGTELASRYDVHFVVGDYGQPRTEQREGVTLHRSYAPDSSGITAQASNLASLLAAMRRADADVYVTRGVQSRRAVFDYLFAKLLGKEWAFNTVNRPRVHERVNSWPLQWLFRRGLHDARAIICQTEYDADVFGDYYGVDPVVVHNGYPAVDSVLDYDDREFFLWVGRIEEGQKRPHRYLDLAEACPDQRFVLVGPPEGEKQYVDTIRERAHALDNVEYPGRVAPDEIHDYYRRAIALVNTSRNEGFPNTFLEAWRYGTPVLSLDVELTRFLPDDEYTEYANGDLDVLQDLVNRLGSDVDFRERLGSRVREQFERRFSIAETAAAYEAALLGDD